MTASIDKIMDRFQYPAITPIVCQPGYDTIAEINLQLNFNVACMSSHIGNGTLGILFLAATPAVYNPCSFSTTSQT